MNCGLEPDGIFSQIHGPCPVARAMKFDGVNGGKGAGRACWLVKDHLSAGQTMPCRNHRLACINCEFYRRVQNEEESSRTVEKNLEPIGDSEKLSF